MDVAGMAWHRLHDEPDLVAALDQRLYRHRLPVVIEGTALAAAVLSPAQGWAPPNRHNTAEFPRLRIEIYQDSSSADVRDAEDRAHDLWETFNKLLHVPRGMAEMWGPVRVIGAHRVSEPELFPVTDQESVALLTCDYGITLG